MTDQTPIVDIDELAEAQPRLDSQLMTTFGQAASVCLDRHHVLPILLTVVEDEYRNEAELKWNPSTDAAKSSWGQQNDTVEWGAVGVTLAFLGTARGLIATRRAQRGSGADYYVAPPDGAVEDLEGVVRLEISGVDRDERTEIERRLKRKVQQLRDGETNSPGIAVVVGFRAKSILLATLEPE